MMMIGKVAPENLHAIAEPVARPMPMLEYVVGGFGPRSLFQNKYNANVMKTATGTSVVTSIPCANKFGENAINPSANRPEALPNMSRAQRNTIRPPSVA